MVYLPHFPIPSSLGKAQIDYETVFERMAEVLDKLDNPHKKLPPIIHIAGTNGKGSTAALLKQIFSCANYKTHLYTSPHLHDCNERIILNGEKISDNFLFEIMESVRIASQNIKLTFMEAFTIGAFLAFSKVEADILILECGMGGRIDATNIIEEKLAAIITPISFDHMEYLGNSIERIALEKAMIMRPKTPLIVASQPKDALRIIDLLAKDQKIPTYYYDQDFSLMLDEESKEFDVEFFGKKENFYLENIAKPALIGSHQYINFSTAIACILAMKEQFPNLFQINQDHIKQAVTTVSWQSRLEKVSNNLNKILQNKNSEIWIDGAHNIAGSFALARWILERKLEENFNKKVFVITGFSHNKCKKEFLENFKNVADEIIAITVDGEPYPEKAKAIAEIANLIPIKNQACNNLLEAIEQIAKNNNDAEVLVVICGSLHLARDVKKFGSKL